MIDKFLSVGYFPNEHGKVTSRFLGLIMSNFQWRLQGD